MNDELALFVGFFFYFVVHFVPSPSSEYCLVIRSARAPVKKLSLPILEGHRYKKKKSLSYILGLITLPFPL